MDYEFYKWTELSWAGTRDDDEIKTIISQLGVYLFFFKCRNLALLKPNGDVNSFPASVYYKSCQPASLMFND